MRVLNRILTASVITLLFFLPAVSAYGDPMVDFQFQYVETQISTGWQYDYTLINLSDDDLNIYNLSFEFTIGNTLSVISWPDEWIYSYGDGNALPNIYGFADFLSPDPAYDILSGSKAYFSFQFNYRPGPLDYELYIVNTDDPNGPFTPTGTSAPVPEPATIFLMASGLGGLALMRCRWGRS